MYTHVYLYLYNESALLFLFICKYVQYSYGADIKMIWVSGYFYLDAVRFSRTSYICYEDQGPAKVMLVLDKPAIENITIQINSTTITATGESCTYTHVMYACIYGSTHMLCYTNEHPTCMLRPYHMYTGKFCGT